jgi:prepilin-type N-terminal cleavage/methylation domain-containing protein
MRGDRKAYTLLEMLLVIVLLGISSAMVIPSISSTDVLRVQAAVRSVVADIAYAQSDALARQEGRAIIFDVDTNSYSVVEVKGPTLFPATDTIMRRFIREVDQRGNSQITGVDFEGSNTIVFDSLGGPVQGPGSTTPGNGGTITITGSGSTFIIGVEAYTGRVTVTRP